MKKYIIRWNIGYGDNVDIVEAENKEDAMNCAYEAWSDDLESNADYSVIGEATEELRELHDLQDESDG